MDQANFENLLRAELTIPTGLDSAQRVAALEEAFRPLETPMHYQGQFNASYGSALAYLVEGDQLDFFGTVTLSKAFGGDLLKPSFGPADPKRTPGEEWMTGLRRRAYRYVVVGRRPITTYQKTRHHVVAVAMRMTPGLLHAEATVPLYGPVETLKLRSGLLNKLQATLLVEHLNAIERDQSPRSSITWSVEEGPEAEACARAWLDALDPMYRLMRRESGETAAWGLGDIARRAIATFRMESGLVLSEFQVFSVQAPRVVLPPRYVLGCSSPDGDTVYMAADEYSGVGVRRRRPCPTATEFCEFIADSNLLPNDNDAFVEPRATRHFFSRSAPSPHADTFRYALGFTKEETAQVQAFLEAAGFGTFVAARLGQGGNFNPIGFEDHHRVKTVTVPGTVPLEVEFFTHR